MQKSLIAIVLLGFIILFGLFPQFPSFSEANDQDIPKSKQTATPSEDLVIDIAQNASAVGQFSNINFTITLLNNGSTTMYDLNVTVNTTSSNVDLAPTSSFSHSSLAVSQSLMYELNLGIIEPDAIQTSVDVVLLIDASGSMGEEISSVQSQLNNLVSVLETEITDLQIGVVVYGWSKYSEYPMSNTNNYVELTSNFEVVKSLINELYASGGTEPWGDALYLVNTWDWRDTANKLIIMVGDEDCDPGQVVGKNHGDNWYNGSQLLDVVTDLKNKGVIINTVVTEGPDAHVEHQFQWIADYTEGESVYLPDLEHAADPITLPELIQEWTLERSREYFHWLSVNTTWSDGALALFTNSAKVSFWMDLAAPSIIHYERVIQKAGGLHDVQILAEVRDISEISNVILYHDVHGFWAVEPMLYDNSSELYVVTLPNVPVGYNLTFFIEATDVLKNSGSSPEYWMIIETLTHSLGETATALLNSGELETTLFRPLSSMSVYLWMFCEPAANIDVNLTRTTDPNSVITPELDIILDLGNESRKTLLFKFSLSIDDYLLTIAAPEAISESLMIKYTWLTTISLANQSVTNSMSDNIRKHLYRWTLHEEWYLFVDYTPYSDLVVYGEVFYENWTYIGNITVSNDVQLQPGNYYVLIHGVLRTGEYRLILSPDPSNIDDGYYMDAFKTTNATNAPGFFLILCSLFLIALVLVKKKRKREKLM
ncbi:MAG: VWA domain-containing protein [Promethearchaeota archaeon]